MDSQIFHLKSLHHHHLPPLPPPPPSSSSVWQIMCRPRPCPRHPISLRCAKQGGSGMMEDGLMAIETGLEAAELVGMSENCQDGGIVELLECLEKEAIMGEDKGRNPNDYNRRALIFHTSSRVFQALNQKNSSSSSLH